MQQTNSVQPLKIHKLCSKKKKTQIIIFQYAKLTRNKISIPSLFDYEVKILVTINAYSLQHKHAAFHSLESVTLCTYIPPSFKVKTLDDLMYFQKAL